MAISIRDRFDGDKEPGVAEFKASEGIEESEDYFPRQEEGSFDHEEDEDNLDWASFSREGVDEEVFDWNGDDEDGEFEEPEDYGYLEVGNEVSEEIEGEELEGEETEGIE